jgi:hypothetical protein
MRRALGDAVVSAAALALLFLALVLIDPRIRARLAGLAGGTPGQADAECLGWQCLGGEVRDVSTMALETATYQFTMHTPLAVFTLAAVVLVLFMVRT